MVRYFVIALLILGLVGWLIVFDGFHSALICFGPFGPGGLLIFSLLVVALAMIPPIASELDRLLHRFRKLTLRTRTVGSVVAGCASSLFLWLTALAEHRQFFPYIHDEFSYLIQAHQFAAGHLWMPAHPLAGFFDSFQLLVKPVYASAYFPGTALLYVPGIWLHLPPFLTSLFIAGVIAGLLFWITVELLDGIAGVLAVLLLWSDDVYRQMSLLTMAQMPLLLYGLLAIVAWLRWRSTGSIKWMLLIGLFLGFAVVTRPVDSLCFAIPIFIAVGFRNARQSWAMVAGAIPLLCLQLILNHGITGSWLRTPFELYTDRDYPGMGYGFHPYDPMVRPESDLLQKQSLYREYLPTFLRHRPENILDDLLHPHGPYNGARIGLVLSQKSPTPFAVLILLLPLSLLGMTKMRGGLLSTMPLFLLLYAPYLFFFPHYVLTAAPALIVGILVGANVLCTTWKSTRRFTEVGFTLLIGGMAIAALPQWVTTDDDMFNAPLLGSINHDLEMLPHRPAVVLFVYDAKRNTHEEPVYNADVAWPDDAEVIRANDRGAQDQAIFNYYAQHQPQRWFYRFDESTRALTVLGRATELGR